MAAYYVENFEPPMKQAVYAYSQWVDVGEWNPGAFDQGVLHMEIDLSDGIKLPGQYLVDLSSDCNMVVLDAEIHYEGRKALEEFVKISGAEIRINRTAMVTEESSSVLYLTLRSDEPCEVKARFKPALIY